MAAAVDRTMGASAVGHRVLNLERVPNFGVEGGRLARTRASTSAISALTAARSSSIIWRRSMMIRQRAAAQGAGRKVSPRAKSAAPPWIASTFRVDCRVPSGTTGIAVIFTARIRAGGGQPCRQTTANPPIGLSPPIQRRNPDQVRRQPNQVLATAVNLGKDGGIGHGTRLPGPAGRGNLKFLDPGDVMGLHMP